MGSVSSPNPGVADLLQIFSNAGSPTLSSVLSSPQVQSALQKAPPADLVQLSDQALQLQEVNGLFGSSNPSQTAGLFSTASPSSSSAALDNLFTSLFSSSPGSTTSSTPASIPSSPADQLAIDLSESQSEQTQAFLGTETPAGASGTLLNVLA
jgi:hypothetical protein